MAVNTATLAYFCYLARLQTAALLYLVVALESQVLVLAAKYWLLRGFFSGICKGINEQSCIGQFLF